LAFSIAARLGRLRHRQVQHLGDDPRLLWSRTFLVAISNIAPHSEQTTVRTGATD
jgi:hypothetical protein